MFNGHVIESQLYSEYIFIKLLSISILILEVLQRLTSHFIPNELDSVTVKKKNNVKSLFLNMLKRVLME